MTAGAEAVAEAVKTPWDQMCARDLFQPLGMSSSSYSHAQFETRSNKATLHVPVDGAYKPLYQRDADAQAPSGGVSSAVGNLSSWVSMVLANGTVKGQPLIDASVLQQSFTRQVQRSPLAATDARPLLRLRRQPRHHVDRTGRVGALRGVLHRRVHRQRHPALNRRGHRRPDQRRPHRRPRGGDQDLHRLRAHRNGRARLVRLLLDDLCRRGRAPEQGRPPPPTSPAPARPLSSYVGTYANAYVGDVKVTESNGVLTVTLGPQNLSAPLTHNDGDTFSGLIPGQTHPPDTAVTFAGGPAGGPPQTMSIEALTVGELTRS